MIADLHCHYFPLEHTRGFRDAPVSGALSGDSLRLLVEGRALEPPAVLVDPRRQADRAEAAGFDRQVLSPPPFAVAYELPASHGLDWSRRLNDGLAAAVSIRPDRLAAFATVPLQAGGAVAAAELDRAVTDLGLSGVELLTSVAGAPLDTPELADLWATAERLRVPVLIHPHFVSGADRMREFHLRNVVGNPVEVALTAAQLLLGGLTVRYPRLTIVLAHGGGALPSLVGRLQHAYTHRDEYAAVPVAPRDGLRAFHYDTVVFDPRVLRHLTDLVGADRLVPGSDFPFDMAEPDPVAFVRSALDWPDAETALSGATSLLDSTPSRGGHR